MLFKVTHNYLDHHLGYVVATDSHNAILRFHDKTGMALSALVAIPVQMTQADLSNTSLAGTCFNTWKV
jgi:hypothetical protein